jgi:hypothetical protein
MHPRQYHRLMRAMENDSLPRVYLLEHACASSICLLTTIGNNLAHGWTLTPDHSCKLIPLGPCTVPARCYVLAKGLLTYALRENRSKALNSVSPNFATRKWETGARASYWSFHPPIKDPTSPQPLGAPAPFYCWVEESFLFPHSDYIQLFYV